MATFSSPLSPAVAAFLFRWKDYLAHVKHASPLTVASYERHVLDFLGFLAARRERPLDAHDLLSVDMRDGRAWLSALRERGVGARSANLALSAVRGFYRYLERQGEGANEAVFALRFARKEKLLPKPAAHGDVDALLRSWREIFATDPPWAVARDVALCVLLYGTGMRISEALSLARGAISEGTESVYVVGKGSKERRVPVIEAVARHVAAYKTYLSPDPDAPLFVGARGKRLHPDVARLRLRLVRRALGLGEHLSPHSLRHGFATELLEQDGDLRVIQELLGHASLSTTEIYAKLSDKRMTREYLAFHPRAGR
jgi:integrase/recombinase XerC